MRGRPRGWPTSTPPTGNLRDDPVILEETRHYLRDVIRLLEDKPTALAYYDQLTALYPDRLNPGVVWLGAVALLGS